MIEPDAIPGAVPQTRPHVTIEQIDAAIRKIEIAKYLTAGGQILRWAVITMKNGFAVTGDPSAAVDPLNDDATKGQFYATENAKRKIWQYMVFELKSKLKLIEDSNPPTNEDFPTYIGTKVVHAIPMDRRNYNALRGWTLPKDENGDDEGYLVEYADLLNTPNHEDYKGYISWSPKDVFEGSYTSLGSKPKVLSFLDRLEIEHEELDSKLLKLELFLSIQKEAKTLDDRDLADLYDQAALMTGYKTVLERRLNRLR
jgi:hypothetical protein